jgi:hypothetical protein
MNREGDLVLIHMDNSPAFFARIESIAPDVKPEWFHVKLLVLQVPLLTITWILKEAYYSGDEFTMGGHPMRIEKVVAPPEDQAPEQKDETEKARKPERPAKPTLVKTPAKVLSLADRRKKDPDS